ncbi:hypothetical protein [Paludisphaera sp.]|uniref:hypothetical protein n=1 Tax=Paludisphaera sp. TaxID=2017432 RepID=UPI00301C890B
MRIRFWKVWALTAGFLTASALAPSLSGQEAAAGSKAKPAPTAEKPKAAAASGRKVVLEIAVSSGTRGEGCKIEVKPANATCRFTAKTVEVSAGGGNADKEKVTLDDVEILGADRNLSVAITIHEADGASKTVYRGYRVAAEPKSGRPEQFTCWITSPSRSAVIAAPDPAPTRR